ncbi:zinc finger SWIM domain-containing protein 7 isoform X1 [Senna tora]|uniref:Zinc finger SWIM domain-containing protein 7 isoform X1 n=1 Tax=Senna tora TaxID=362788 RepID=A0A834W9Y3_9FABA|nr:zinc finger SWIM domain-containing protein 7 isoform X1 [Senna tora]
MSASSSVAEATWKEIASRRSATVTDDHLWTSVNFVSDFSLKLLSYTMGTDLCLFDSFAHKTSLHFIFGKNFERATRIVDQRGVKKISGEPSGRFIFQVMGESRRKEEYLCFPENFCACYSFFYDVVNRAEQLCCKHQIAARLAASMEAYVEVKVSDEELAILLSKL